MKKNIFICVLLIVILVPLIFIVANKKDNNDEVLRLHIRANSNDEADQMVKLKVRDELVKYVQKIIVEANSKKQVENIIKANKEQMLLIADEVLKENGLSYVSNMKVTNEFFPTRNYGDISFESGYYDSVIIELGSGKGDNWWCALYPPLCFVGTESDDFEYKSKILEIIKNFKNKKISE